MKAKVRFPSALPLLGVALLSLQGILATQAHAEKPRKALPTALKLLSPVKPVLIMQRDKQVSYFQVEWEKEFKLLVEGPALFALLVRGVIEGKLPEKVKLTVVAERDGAYRSENLFSMPIDTQATVPGRIGALVTEARPLLFEVPEGKHTYVFRLRSNEARRGACKLEIWKKPVKEYLAAKEKLIPVAQPPKLVSNAETGKAENAGLEIPLEPIVAARGPKGESSTMPEKKGAGEQPPAKAAGAEIEIPVVPIVPSSEPGKEEDRRAESLSFDEVSVVPDRGPGKEEARKSKGKEAEGVAMAGKPGEQQERGAIARPDESVEAARKIGGVPWLRIAAWGSLALAGVSGGTGVVFGLMSKSNADKVADRNGDGVYDLKYAEAVQARDDSKSQALTANVLFGVAGTSLVASAVLLAMEYDIFGWRWKESSTGIVSPALRVEPGADSLSISFGGRF